MWPSRDRNRLDFVAPLTQTRRSAKSFSVSVADFYSLSKGHTSAPRVSLNRHRIGRFFWRKNCGFEQSLIVSRSLRVDEQAFCVTFVRFCRR
jgi:hypothetical protein